MHVHTFHGSYLEGRCGCKRPHHVTTCLYATSSSTMPPSCPSVIAHRKSHTRTRAKLMLNIHVSTRPLPAFHFTVGCALSYTPPNKGEVGAVCYGLPRFACYGPIGLQCKGLEPPNGPSVLQWTLSLASKMGSSHAHTRPMFIYRLYSCPRCTGPTSQT